MTPLGLTVNVDLYLYVDAYGTIQAETVLSYNSKVEWARGAGFRKEQSSGMETSLGVEADIGFGGDIAAAICAFGVDVFDAGAKVGGEIDAQAKVVGGCEETVADGLTTQRYTEAMKVDATLYAPIVTLYAGSEDCLIGESGSWNLLTKKNTWSLPLLDREWVFWEKTLYFDEDGNAVKVGPEAGDFSEFAGTYRADAAQQMYSVEEQAVYSATFPDIILYEDGTLEGGWWFFGSFDPYRSKVPYAVQIDNGVISCELSESAQTYDEDGEPLHTYVDVGYYIYPVGVSDPYFKTEEDASKIRLTYVEANSGVFYANYTKVD